MRLIDADVFEVVCFQGKSDEFLEGAKYILEMIDAQPTAYDIEKVVAELDEYLIKLVGRGSALYQTVMHIVKKGGVE